MVDVPNRDRLLAVLVAVCWGLNFPATALALEHFPPLFMVALRFALVALPTVLLVPRPAVRLRWLFGTGLGMGVLQFAFLYLGMAAGMPSGLASLVLQASAPFTVLLAGVFLRERLTRRQVAGIVIAVGGLAAIAAHLGQTAALLPVALIVEGPAGIGASLTSAFSLAALPSVLGLLYIVLIATVLGYGLWNRLLSNYPSSTVAPFSMLVPVVGVISSWLIFGETFDAAEIVAGAAVIGGVLVGSLPTRRPTVPVSSEPVSSEPVS